MEIWNNIKSSVCNFHTFDNYFNDQPAIELLKTNYSNNQFGDSQTIISTNSGNGVTHLIHAICNKWIDNGKNILYITGQSIIYILKKIKSQIDLKKFQSHLLSFQMLAIDNIQFFYKKSVRFSQFIIELIKKCKEISKPLFLGCSQPDKDFTKSKKQSKTLSLQRIDLKPLSSINIFKVFKNLCEYENMITENLMYVISGYNGSVQEHVNCLISIRFKSKVDGINIESLSPIEIEEIFNIKKYFSKQQFRKCFKSGQLSLWNHSFQLQNS